MAPSSITRISAERSPRNLISLSAVAAAASPDYGWKRASLFLGNAVAHWSRAWTVDSNPYSSRFEREGHEAREYRYRLRSTPPA